MSGQSVGGIIGGAIGFVVSGGNPIGAQIGFAVGAGVGAYVDPVRVKGPRLTDATTQTSTVGGVIPFGYGTFVTAGNVIWCGDLKEHKKTQRQGKGGGAKTTTYTYTRSYAVGVCQGAIYGFRWIKRNGKKVYTTDPNATAEELAYSAKWLQKCTLYLGSEAQMPDSTIVAREGVGNVSAFRGLAYIVVENDDLTDLSGAIPQYEFCVFVGAAKSYTTPPYPVYTVDSLATYSIAANGKAIGMPLDELNTLSHALDGQLRDIVQIYSYQESVNAGSYALNGILRTPLAVYKNYQPESINTGSYAQNGTLRVMLIVYPNYQPESLDASSYALNGTLK